ncbi:MAG: hypothetical protein WBA12_12790 [Catalinimonas sp.]
MDKVTDQTFENEYMTGRLSGGVVVAYYKSHVLEIDAEVARRCTETSARFAAGRRVPVLLLANRAAKVTTEAMRIYSDPEGFGHISAMAIIVHSPLQKWFVNLYLRYVYRRLDMPTRLYRNQAAALTWLKQFTVQDPVYSA